MKDIIFLISMPRSGSTIVQKLLETDSSIISCSEPWFLLPLLSIGNQNISLSRYDERLFSLALSDAEKELGFDNLFYKNINKSCHNIYKTILEKHSNKKFFLDKTPRYVHILPRLINAFPRSIFIFLQRNPVDLLASYLSTWCKGSFDAFYAKDDFRFDFEHGLPQYASIFASYKSTHPSLNCAIVKYEDLNAGLTEFSASLESLNINIDLNKLGQNQTHRPFGDPKRAQKSTSVKVTTEGWRNLDRENISKMVNYLKDIDDKCFANFGYDKDESLDTLQGYLSRSSSGGSSSKPILQCHSLSVGVAINIFNTPSKDIVRALLSCCTQTKPPNEIVIYDDASTSPLEDKFYALLEAIRKRFSSIKISYYRSHENKGIAFSRDKAICMLDTYLVTHLDGDDYYRSRKLEYETGKILACDDKRRIVACSDILLLNGLEMTVKNVSDFCSMPDKSAGLLLRSCAIPRDIMMLKSSYCDFARFDPTFRIYEDYHSKLKLANAGFDWLYSGVGGTVYQRSLSGLSRVDAKLHNHFEGLAFRSIYPSGHPSQDVESAFYARLESRLR